MKSESVLHPILQSEEFLSIFSKRTIYVIAPASGIKEEEFNQLRELPFPSMKIPNDLLSPVVPYHAHSDEVRLAQLKMALYESNPGDLIWCLRGGYGSARLIDGLAHLTPPLHERILIGYSDITALHLFISQQWRWPTIHGAGLSQLLSPQWDIDNFRRLAQCIEHPDTPQTIHLTPLNEQARQSLALDGRITGGNLTLVENSIGTPWHIETAGCIVFLEEVGEKGYRIDRMLTHLRQAKIFDGVKAVVFGQCLSEIDQELIQFALNRFSNEVGVPVFQSEEFGHGTTNYPIRYRSYGTIEQLVLRMQLS